MNRQNPYKTQQWTPMKRLRPNKQEKKLRTTSTSLELLDEFSKTPQTFEWDDLMSIGSLEHSNHAITLDVSGIALTAVTPIKNPG